MTIKLKQYEFSIKIDEYIFNRFVKPLGGKDNKETFEEFKKNNTKSVCNFILRDKKETRKREHKIYLWDVSERKPLGEKINK